MLNVKLEAMELQDKIKKILQEYYPYCDDEDLSKELLDLHIVSYCDCEDSHKITMTTRKCVACKKLVNE